MPKKKKPAPQGGAMPSISEKLHGLFAGLRAGGVHAADLPTATAGSLMMSPRDFLLVVDHGMRTAIRYKRPFSIIDMELSNADELRASSGVDKVRRDFETLVTLVSGMLRNCDIVSANSKHVVMALPETRANQAGVIMYRMQKRITKALALPLHLECRVSQGDKGLALIKALEQP